MSSKLIMFVLLLGITVIGLLAKLYRLNKRINDFDFVNNYLAKMGSLLHNSFDTGSYTYLLNNATKLSDTLGVYGIMDYSPPFANYIHKNYNIINLILNYNGEISNQELSLAMKSVHIYLGACQNNIAELRKQFKNPFTLFSEGFRLIFNIPLFVLSSLGIIPDRIYHRIKSNIIYSFFQNILGLIGFISSVVGIIQGKEVLLKFYTKASYFLTSIF